MTINRRDLHANALAAAARVRETQGADAEAVGVVMEAVATEKGHARRRRFWAARLAAGLVKDFHQVRQAVLLLAQAEAWHLRYRALRCLDADSPRDFAAPLLRTSLQDPHRLVRYMAACMTGSLALTELADDVARYVERYSDESTWVAEFWLPRLRV